MKENQVYGLESEPLPDDIVPLEAVTILKCMQSDGEIVLWYRSTSGLQSWDRLGLLEKAAFREKSGGWEE